MQLGFHFLFRKITSDQKRIPPFINKFSIDLLADGHPVSGFASSEISQNTNPSYLFQAYPIRPFRMEQSSKAAIHYPVHKMNHRN